MYRDDKEIIFFFRGKIQYLFRNANFLFKNKHFKYQFQQFCIILSSIYALATQLCHIPNGISLAEQTYYFPIFSLYLFFRFYRANLAIKFPLR